MTNEATRPLYDGLPGWAVAGFYICAGIAIFAFAFGCWRLIARYLGNRAGRKGVGRRIALGATIGKILLHTGISRRAGLAGIAHAGVFYGFIALFAGTSILAIEELIARPLGLSFWHGGFYRIYSLILDVAGLLLLGGLTIFALRRALRPKRLDYSRADGAAPSGGWRRFKLDDWTFLWLLIFIGASGYLLEGLRIAQYRPAFEIWSPVGYGLGRLLNGLGVDGETANMLRMSVWWIHGVASLSWIAAIPYTKAVHMLTGPGSFALRDTQVSRRLHGEPDTGYGDFGDFSAAHLLNLDACTKCGRCHEACPAHFAGTPLSPRDLILDLRLASRAGVEGPLVPGILDPKAIWSCLQCNACVEICPVGIEHVPIINNLRRAEVEKGDVETGLQTAFEAVLNTGNSFGQSKLKRAKWAKTPGIDLPDARKAPVDILWFVGDYASFDARNQRNTLALARLLRHAGVNVGILYEAEKTAGNDIRRSGEEGLFQRVATANIEAIGKCSFSRILTSDPHSFNTLRNEYPALGATWKAADVVHHSVFLLELLKLGKLTVKAPLAQRVTYHDACTLGRYNGIFEEPRELLTRLGLEIVEMPRNRDNSFCCGAGGGRIWMADTAAPGGTRPSHDRIREAMGLGALSYFVVACPKDVIMYEEAIAATGHADQLKLREVSELVAEATGIAYQTG